jgi:hypothetical protein
MRILLPLLALAAVCLLFLPTCRVVWQFDHLEQHAKKVITAAELQAWATNLLSRYGTNAMDSFYPAKLGTNFPGKLLKLYHNPPYIVVYGQGVGGDVPHVVLVWGGGFIGHAGFEIGPTNFPGLRGTNAWAPGVYFFTGP